jgi:hypothetical protein
LASAWGDLPVLVRAAEALESAASRIEELESALGEIGDHVLTTVYPSPRRMTEIVRAALSEKG